MSGSSGDLGAQGTQGTQGRQGTQGLGLQGVQGSPGGGIGGGVITDDTTTDGTRYPVFVDVTSGPANATYVSSSKYRYNPSSGTLIAVDFNSTSDISLKTNIKPIYFPLSKLVLLNGVTFNWKESNRPSVGVIAQDIEKVFPELVSKTNPKTVNYDGLIGLLIEAIKEQQIELESIKEKNNLLEIKLNKIFENT